MCESYYMNVYIPQRQIFPAARKHLAKCPRQTK